MTKEKNSTYRECHESKSGKVSDKWDSYLDVYHEELSLYRQKNITLLEIGIQNGGSLDVWADYFPNAKKIIGCDIDEKCKELKYSDKRIELLIGDATTKDFSDVLSKNNNFDLILDDGAHTSGSIIKSFCLLFRVLKYDGKYIIEDLHCGYWMDYEGGLKYPYSSMAFFKKLADIVNYEHWNNNQARIDLFKVFFEKYQVSIDDLQLAEIKSVKFVNSICIIEKGKADKNEIGIRNITGTDYTISDVIRPMKGQQIVHPIQNENPWSNFTEDPVVEYFSLKKVISEKKHELEVAKETIESQKQELESVTLQLHTEEEHFKEEKERFNQELKKTNDRLNHLLVKERKNLVKKYKRHFPGRLAGQLIRFCRHPFSYYRDLRDTIEVRRSRLFDDAWYLEQNPDLYLNTVDLLHHYMLYGWKEGRDPHPLFDTKFYLETYPDVKNAGVNPLLHFLQHGKKEGRTPNKNHKIDNNNNKNHSDINFYYKYSKSKHIDNLKQQFINDQDEIFFEPPRPISIDVSKINVKTIAFYLPQFHPIPENNVWWGNGFTEWTNVARAKPQFTGHYQPHIPSDLGYYDLRLPDIMKQQIEMAKMFGIYGFCIYYYWFGGKRLLEKPLDMFLKNPEWDFKFCICWANENWTRKWDGLNQDILIAQNHSDIDDTNFIMDIIKYIEDPRYITIDDKPLVIIYRPHLFPDIKKTVKRWRKYYKTNFNKDLYLAMVLSFNQNDPTEFGFDAAIEFPPLNYTPKIITDKFQTINFKGYIYDAMSIKNSARNKIKSVDFELFRGVMLNWDNTARRGKNSHIFVNNSPENYESWLTEAIKDTDIHKKEKSKKFVFINAWNEWAEGTHLEPDQKYGYAYLNSTNRAIQSIISIGNNLKIAVLIHAYYLDILPELLTYVLNIHECFTLLISVQKGEKEQALLILDNFNINNFIIKEVENLGFDIAPMFCSFKDELFQYDIVCKIHTKKSTQSSQNFGKNWRQHCLNALLMDQEQTEIIIQAFNKQKNLGIVYPSTYSGIENWLLKKGGSLNQIYNFLPQSLIPHSVLNYSWPVGSFFWFRPESLKLLFDQNFMHKDFKPKEFSVRDKEGIVRDQSLAHSLERIFCYAARLAGYSTAIISDIIVDDKIKINEEVS